ncbi:MAG: hypothetical protein K0U36_03295, partial [Alphaproteobacteria bacterium]|nr:hypothetical protein [Alphaproteobacteria bacterium]
MLAAMLIVALELAAVVSRTPISVVPSSVSVLGGGVVAAVLSLPHAARANSGKIPPCVAIRRVDLTENG